MERAPGEMFDRVPPRLAREFVAVPGDDKEILHVFADDLAVVSPDRRDRVEQERECLHAEVPDPLVTVAVAFFERDKLRKL